MRKAKEISFLPSELWTLIFARLPVKVLLKFRCVCKEWCSIIDSPDFVSLHLTHFKNNCDGYYLLSVGLEKMVLTWEWKWMLRRTDTFRKVINLPELKFSPHCVKGYVNGLLLIHQELAGGQKIILCNPSVRKFLKLPLSPVLGMGRSRLKRVQVGLGYDLSSNDHKVVVIAYSQDTNDASVPAVSVEVFSLNTGCWKSVVCGTLDSFFGYVSSGHPSYWYASFHYLGAQMFVKGAIYWKGHDLRVRCPERKDQKIISFDVVGEMISYIDFPANADDGDRWIGFFLTVLDGSLAILDSFEEHCCIWELDKRGVGMSWSKRYTIDLQWPNELFCLTKDQKLLFVGKDGVQSYDLKGRRINKLAKTYPRNAHFSDLYVESLVLLKGVDGKTM